MTHSTNIPKGTRDFLPEETAKRNYIFDSIKAVFQNYGYVPIETPAMENLSTLLGKYGEEGDKLLFKILNSGNYLKKLDNSNLNEIETSKLTPLICEKGLRYDLTVPFARYVVKNRNELSLPFKRYQIQPVWRADRPQKGRYREFFQCDVDVIGTNSLINEYELILIINDVFRDLELNVALRLNNRKILSGLIDYLDESDKFIPITVAIDKIEKIGIDKVMKELKEIGVKPDSIGVLVEVLQLKGNATDKIDYLKNLLKSNQIGIEGLEEIITLFNYVNIDNLSIKVDFDLSLARGLNYYTGTIFEVVSEDVDIGSICGGGRYDDLTEMFGLKDISGVGVSFGAERIYDVIEKLNKFPQNTEVSTTVMFVNFGEKEEIFCIQQANLFRKHGISTEIYPDAGKLKKQLQYANRKNIPFVIIVGEEELKSNSVIVKEMETGKQNIMEAENLLQFFI